MTNFIKVNLIVLCKSESFKLNYVNEKFMVFS